MIRTCPRCDQRFTVEGDTTDFIHECHSGNEAVDNEDILKIGDWEDFTGSGEEPNTLLQGMVNTLQGTRAGIEGEDEESTTSRGASTELFRTRQHLEFIKLKGGGC